MEPEELQHVGELVKRSYSEDEIKHLYALARLALENGHLNKAEIVLQGLVQVAPDFAPAWLGLSYLLMLQGNFDEAVFACRQALRIDAQLSGALLMLVAGLLSMGDMQSAGTHLGEVGEQIEAGLINDPDEIRFFRVQMARYQNR